jgi:geranylgeranyl pyrophosphate synthase
MARHWRQAPVSDAQTGIEFSQKMAGLVSRIERGIDHLLPPAAEVPARLHEAMRYSMQAGGKRLRPVLVLSAAEIFDRGSQPDPLPAAIAVECIHTYSLIHDDLPCMDNDDLRRGRPTCHRAFDEATALLAGDALLTHAFTLMAGHYGAFPGLATGLVRRLAEASGSRQLIGGQMLDLLHEHASSVTAGELQGIHSRKTGAMIRVSLAIGALVGGATPESVQAVESAGERLGLAFQIVDDILDGTSDAATLGKTPGKDAKSGKTTFLSVHGLEASRRIAEEQTAAAVQELGALPGDSGFLVELVKQLVSRRK